MTESRERAASYGVKQKATGKNLRLRLLLLTIYFGFIIGFCVVFTGIFKMPQLISILPILLLILIPPTWRIVSCEREYSVECGFFVVESLYSFSRRKELTRLEIRTAEKIVPCTEAPKGVRVLDYRGDCHSPDSYCIFFARDGKEYALLFEGAQKLIRAIRRHNDATVVSETLRH